MPLSTVTADAVVVLPVALALLMWGGLAFFVIPVLMLANNLRRGHLRRPSDLRLGWHATRIPLSDVMHRHVWMLTTTMVMPDGRTEVVHTARAPRRTPPPDEVAESVASLEALGVTSVWVSMKMPLLVFLWPAMLPLVLVGEPTALLMAWLTN